MLLHITAFVASLLMQPGIQLSEFDLTNLQAHVRSLVAVIENRESDVEEPAVDIEVAVIEEASPEVESKPVADMAEATVEPAPATAVVEEIVAEASEATAEPVIEVVESVEPVVAEARDLDSIADVWPNLSDSTRQSILMLIEADKLTQE